MAMNPSKIAEKWARNLSGSIGSIQDGVQAVTENPAQKAVAAKQKMIQNFNASMNDGRYDAAMQRVTLDGWKRAFLEKGLPRIASGANAAQPKMAAFLTEFLPAVEAAKAKVDAMPSLTLEDSINRMRTNVVELSKFRYSKSR